MTLRLKRRGSRFFSMTEGRKSQIVLLDERRLDIIVQPKLHSYELLDLVASHFKLREKQYFGLGFIDDTNHFAWLQAEKRVLDHDFPKKSGMLVLYFSIRFYVETIGLLRDSQTVELFYLNARQVLFKGPVECDSETVFELAAHVLQATNGDFVSEEETREELKKLPLIPTCTLREHPSIAYCEDRVICNYEKITGTSRGLAIVNYMTIIENLPTYGIHFYEVKDKKDIPWWLGISPKGIAVYDKDDKKTPRKLFTWKNLENLYYRDKKFSIEVSVPKRDESGNHVSVSRRTFGGASNVDVHAWFAATPHLTKGIWSMAVNQHQFYLDRKQSKSHLPAARSMSEIAADLCRSTTSLPGSLGSDLSRSPSSHSLPSLSNSRYDLTIEQSDSLKAEREMVKALKARKEALEEALVKKNEELKRLCYEEGQLTGVLPHDTPPLAPGEQVPTFRRRVGTSFSLSVKDDDKQNDTRLSSELSKLELEVELQGKITSAAYRLASDKTVSKYVRKQRRQSYTKSVGKLKDMEKKLGDMRRQMGKSVPDHHHHHHHHHHHQSASRMKDDVHRSGGFSSICQATVTHPTPAETYEDQKHHTALSPSHSSPQLSYGPVGGLDGSHNRRENPNQAVISPSPSSTPTYSNMDVLGQQPTPNVGSTNHPTMASHLSYRLDGSHDSGFSSANNMNNVSSQRASSHYDSKDHLRSPVMSEPGVISPLQHQLGQDEYRTNRTTYSQDKDEDRGSSSGSVGGYQGENQYSSVVGNIKPSSSSSTIHYGSLDRQMKNYNKKEMYRDMSPMRHNGEGNRETRYASGGDLHHQRGSDNAVHPSHVLLELPVHHESLQTSPTGGPPSRLDLDQLQIGGPDSVYNATNCYSPRYQEGSGLYKDVDATHIHHPRLPQEDHQTKKQHGNSLYGGHHTASQPTFHRVERNISPNRLAHPASSSSSVSPSSSSSSIYPPQTQLQQQQHYHQTSQPLSTSHPDFHHHHHQQQQQTLSSSSSFPRHIPIQHIDSSQTPPPSSPTSLYSPQTSSSQSSPRGPSTPTSHAPSSLVTVTNLQQPHMEVTKPYEMSDFYRYSEKLRRQRIIDQYQRQLIGNIEKLSRSSTPQSLESDGGHSSHSSSSSHHHLQHNTNPASHSPHPQFNTNSSMPPPSSSRGAMLQYGRSASAPLSSASQRPQYSHHHNHNPIHHTSTRQQPPLYHHHTTSADNIDDPITSSSSSSSSYSVKSQGPGPNSQHYAYQTSYRIQQIHSVYQSPQPMTCKPVKAPPKPEDHN